MDRELDEILTKRDGPRELDFILLLYYNIENAGTETPVPNCPQLIFGHMFNKKREYAHLHFFVEVAQPGKAPDC